MIQEVANTKKKVSVVSKNPTDEQGELREYIAEAELVEMLKANPGWEVISRDFKEYKEQIGSKIAYLNPNSKEFEEARILYIASDKSLKIVEDYIENKKRAMELLFKLDNQQDNIVLDVDNK